MHQTTSEVTDGPQFGNKAYKDYIKEHGRESNRRDLLTKILTPGKKGESMTDRETYVEISNLVFAGTGELTFVAVES